MNSAPVGLKFSAAFVAMQAEMRSPPFDRTNPAFKSGYASLASVMETVRPILHRHGFAVLQEVGERQGRLTVTTTLLHTSGESVAHRCAHKSSDNIQQVGSAISYLRRYAIMAMLGVVGEVDDDGEAAESKPAKQPKPVAKKSLPTEEAQPAGETYSPIRVTPAQTKGPNPKDFYRVQLADRQGRIFEASTWSSTTADMLQEYVGRRVGATITSKTTNGVEYFGVAECWPAQ
jgi:ERF superfamily